MNETLVGQVFGRLTVTAEDSTRERRMWFCICLCGVEKSVRPDHLKSGRTVSCGCHRDDQNSKRLTTHGKTKTRAYRIWSCMMTRCHNPAYAEWHLYGGRGIEVCAKWRGSFAAFFADMGEPPAGMSIDRVSSDGNYEPGNCKWSTAKEQANNRRPRRPKQHITQIHALGGSLGVEFHEPPQRG